MGTLGDFRGARSPSLDSCLRNAAAHTSRVHAHSPGSAGTDLCVPVVGAHVYKWLLLQTMLDFRYCRGKPDPFPAVPTRQRKMTGLCVCWGRGW